MPLPESVFHSKSSILITGASSGIGAALAVQLGRHGGKIALVARREDQLRSVADQVRAASGQPLVVPCDVSDPESVRSAHESIVAVQGPLDVAFLNAGVGDVTSAARFEAGHVRRLFEVNVFGVVHWMEHLLPAMVERGQGILAVTSSLSAARGIPTMGAYAASKAAVSSLLESLRGEARAYGVQISVIEPGYVKSAMTEKNKFPMPFLMEAEEAARLILERVAEGDGLIRFPWQVSAFLQVVRHVPVSLYDRFGASAAKRAKKKQPQS
jgi:short-subunit dehydrogenase